MMEDLLPSTTRRVALRKESVDRNNPDIVNSLCLLLSLSARRAWIEILAAAYPHRAQLLRVALRKESVDRNSLSRAASR